VEIDSTAPAAADYILKTTSTTVATWQLDTGGTEINDLASDGINGIIDDQIAIGSGGDTAAYHTLPNGAVTYATGTNTVSQAALADLSDVTGDTGTGSTVVFDTSPTIVTPTIASFTGAGHDHADAAGGGALATGSQQLEIIADEANAGVASFTDAGAAAFLSAGGSGTYLKSNGTGSVMTWDNPPGSGGIVTGTAASRPAADGSQGFYYATDTQVLSYDDTSVWEEVGIIADDTTLEITTDLHIKDNGVGLAQMAGGTDGNLITYDTAGDPAYVTTGNAGEVLTSAGTDAAPTFQARDLHVRSLTLEAPHGAAAEDFSIFWTEVDITATRIAYAVRGATPSITCTINSNTSRSSAGTVVHTITTGTSTAGTDAAPSGTAAIPAGAYVWLETTAVGAATDELFIAIEYTED
jgi:hypothetical protein